MTADSLCYLAGNGRLIRLPLVEVVRVEKTGGGPFAQRGIAVHTAQGAGRRVRDCAHPRRGPPSR